MTHRRRRLHPSVPLALIAWLWGVAACDPGASAGSVTPGTTRGVDSGLQSEGEFEGESAAELDARLQRLVADHELKVSAAQDDGRQCEELCEISRAICEVKTKMCEIADERVSDGEYQDLCRRAKLRCGEASDSCVRCVQHHQSEAGAASEGDCGEPAHAAD